MVRLLGNLTSFGSLLVAVTMAVVAVYLIQKNSPQPNVIAVRTMPPVSPASDGSSSGTSTANGRSNQAARAFVGGVGIIEPAGEAISVGSQLPGIVAKVMVNPGDDVEAGQTLFVLDDRTSRANIAVARSQWQTEESKLKELLGQIATQQAQVDAALARTKLADATLQNTSREFKRSKELIASNAISATEYDQTQLNFEVAQAQHSEAAALYRKELAELELLAAEPNAPRIEVQKSAIAQARAALEREEVLLEQHKIVAPKASRVLQVKVRAGEFVPAAVLTAPVVTLGVVNPLHVRVDIDEADIPRFRSDAKASASLRGSPQTRVPLTYVRTEPFVIPKKTLTGSVSERVDTRVLQVIYALNADTLNAWPGQQVDIYIDSESSSK